MRAALSLFLLIATPAALLAQAPSTTAAPAPEPFDIVIINGHIIDGTGSPWYSGEVGIRAGRIAAIGNCDGRASRPSTPRQGRRSRLHRHARPVRADHARRSAAALQDLPGHHHRNHGRRRVGRAAECRHDRGRSRRLRAPAASRPTGTPCANISPGSRSQGMGINLASYVGATSVRRMVLGDADVQPTPRPAGADAGAGRARPCGMARWACRPRCNMRRRPMPRQRN